MSVSVPVRPGKYSNLGKDALDSQRQLLEEFCALCLADTVYDPVTPGSGEVSEVE